MAAISLVSVTEARPNILVFFLDELRFDWVNNGTETDFLQTPHIDSIRERGLHFKRAITASPVCGPSRACFAAASHYEEVGVLTNRYNFPINRMTTYYKLLQEAGYHTMAVGKLDLNKNDTLNSFGWNHDGNLHAEEWGFSDMVNCVGVFESYFLGEPYPNGSYIEPYTDYLLEHNATDVFLNDTRARTVGGNTKIGDPRFYKDTFPNPLPDELYNDNWVADQALRLLREKPDDKEWFMIVNWNGPHYPMSITESMYGRMQNQVFPQPVDYTGNFTAAMHNRTRADYAAMIENIDAHIGRILAAVNLSETVVFSECSRILLADRAYWANDERPTNAGVSLIDLARTFLDVGEVENVPPQMSEAYSFRALLEGKPYKKRVLRSALGAWKLWFDGRYKYVIGYSDDEPMLFDVETDPHERTNLLLSTNKTELANYACIIQWLLGKGEVVQ
ncbi:uncharacterized protein PITG_15323 [Phytophthora infestans T30-4]|uniref:Sulfatase N-terminal domain-containing protein n=1 Tax=Phytophthora infestans (strain T30-4) TaxID=403677 RepID=D0NQF8_PHYIT|nr:uncharacterized protein PITG_15323 [Phytophthora infestans T30-4]EEY62890.1 conserved hypothetical protein [Phytophthora infestans T30-4]|eukprot:XP_002898765.1 conserved hypothetical protein [Phytophthora infestans T30-4]